MDTTKAGAMSFQDLSRALEFLPSVTIYKAREIVTLDPANLARPLDSLVGSSERLCEKYEGHV